MRTFPLLLLLLSFLPAAHLAAQNELSINVYDIQANGEGRIVFLLFDREDDFGGKPEAATYRAEVTDFGSKARYTFTDLPPGTYAVMAFQDLNENGILDKNFIGIPKEPLVAYRMKRLSRPTFTGSSVVFTGRPLTIDLKLLNQ